MSTNSRTIYQFVDEEIRQKLHGLPDEFTILVCGGRDFGDVGHSLKDPDLYKLRWDQFRFVQFVLCKIRSIMNPKLFGVVQGGARGVDLAACSWARGFADLQERNQTFPADWKRYGKAAGSVRNQIMLHESRPDFVLAFPGGRGTEDMCRRAELNQVPVVKVPYPL